MAKTNVKMKSAKILLGGEEKTLIYDMNSFCALEELYGTVEAAFKELTTKATIKNVRAFLWAGLQNGPDESLYPKLNEVGAMVDPNDIPGIVEALQKCLEESTPEKSEVEKNK